MQFQRYSTNSSIQQSNNPPIHFPLFLGGHFHFYDGIALQRDGLGLFLD